MRSSPPAATPPPPTSSRSRRRPTNAKFQMGEAEESLAAELGPSGALAWQRLHGDVSSQLVVEIAGPDGTVEHRCGWRSLVVSPPVPTVRAGAPRTKARASRRGRRSRCRSRPRSTAPRVRSACSTAAATTPTTSSPRCATATSTVARSTRWPTGWFELAAQLPRLPPHQGGCARARGRAAVVGPVRTDRDAGGKSIRGRATSLVHDAFSGFAPPARGAGRAGLTERCGGRRDPRAQAQDGSSYCMSSDRRRPAA